MSRKTHSKFIAKLWWTYNTDLDNDETTLEDRASAGIKALLNDIDAVADRTSQEMLKQVTLALCSNILRDAQTIANHSERTEILSEDVKFASKNYSK